MAPRWPAWSVRFRLFPWGAAGFLVLLLLTAARISEAVTDALPPIGVTIVESDGIERHAWPVTFGVPFPRSSLHDVAGVALVDEKGVAEAVQTRVLSRWDDGSVRWVLLDAQVSVGARQSRRWQVVSQKSGRKTNPAKLEVRAQAGGFQVDTGELRFAVPKNHFGILEEIEAGEIVLRAPLTSALSKEGQRSMARPPKQIFAREQGPLRVRLELQGDYGNGFDYVIRVDAYAGKPFVRVLHTFVDRDRAALVRVPEIAVEWPIGLRKFESYAVGVDGAAPHTGSLGGSERRFTQVDNLTYRLDGEEKSGKLEGWVSARTKSGVLGLAGRWFWQEYPQGFSVKPGRLTYALWDPGAEAATVGMGAAKTHEFVLWVDPTARAGRDWAVSLIRPLVAVVDPKWVVHTRALPGAVAPGLRTDPFLRQVDEGFDRYRQRNDAERWDAAGRVRCAEATPERPRTGAYGMWNWGDWNFPGYQDRTKGCDAWGNLEYDTAQVLALAFAATGRPEVYEAMVVAARHFMDVDTIHFQAQRPEWVGMNHPKNPLHFSFALGGVDLGHTWTEGLLSYYYLTGDERALETARGIAEYLVRRTSGAILSANPRQLGWPQIALIAVYEATGEGKYLDAAHAYARRGIQSYAADSVSHWKYGILADALAYTHAATRDPEVEDWLRRYAQIIIGDRKPAPDARLLPAVAYVAALTGDQKLRAVVLKDAERLNLGNWGKPFTINGRLGFRIRSLLAEPLVPAPPVARSPATSPPKRQKKH